MQPLLRSWARQCTKALHQSFQLLQHQRACASRRSTAWPGDGQLYKLYKLYIQVPRSCLPLLPARSQMSLDRHNGAARRLARLARLVRNSDTVHIMLQRAAQRCKRAASRLCAICAPLQRCSRRHGTAIPSHPPRQI